MAVDIKTRQSNKGTIRTIDRVSAMTSHAKDVQARTKEIVLQPRSNDGEQVSSRAQDQMGTIMQSGTIGAVKWGADAAKAGYQIRKGRERILQRQASSSATVADAEREIIGLSTRVSDIRSGTWEGRTVRQKTAFLRQRKRVIGRHARISKRPTGVQAASVRQQYQKAKYTKQAARQSQKATQRILRALKAVLQSTRVLIASLSAGGAIAFVIIIVFVLFGAAFYTFGDDSSDNYIEVSSEVQAYTPVISKYAQQYGIGEYVELIKAVMMQESGGRGTDPMQCSESPYNKKYSRAPGGIKDPEYSINCGVHYLADCLKQAKCNSPVDMSHIRLALQGYNYGNGYISWAIKRDGGYTVENAAVFSDMQAKKHGWSGYGDKQYPAHVLRYYPYGSYNIGVVNTAIVKVAQQQIGNQGGRKFWSWYGFGGRVSWCGCFVSYCADQCGYIKSGTIPKFSYVPSIVDWAKSHHQWQTRNYKPSPGDIIVIDWYANGTRDHVGIVESCDGRIVHTVEGNRTDQVGRGSYAVGSGTILGYFVPKY